VAEIEVEGASRLESTLGHAARQLGELTDAQSAAGRIIAAQAAAAAPRKTGALAASLRWASEPGQLEVESDLDYAGPQNFGVPAHNIRASLFLTNAPTDTETQWGPAYEENVQAILDTVQGA
jgi:hypothetical protein